MAQPLGYRKSSLDYDRDRRLAMAYELMREGTSTAPVGHWLQGLGRVFQAGTGKYMADTREGEIEASKAARQKALADALTGFQNPYEPQNPADMETTSTVAPGRGQRIAELLAQVSPEDQPFALTAANAMEPYEKPLERIRAEAEAGWKSPERLGQEAAATRTPLDYVERVADIQGRTNAKYRKPDIEKFSQKPVEVMGPDGKPILVQVGDMGTIRPMQGYGPATPPGLFDGQNIMGQALNQMVASGQMTKEQAQRWAAARTVIDPVKGPTIVTPDAIPGAMTAPNATGPGGSPQPGGGKVTLFDEVPLKEEQGKTNLYAMNMQRGQDLMSDAPTPNGTTIQAWLVAPDMANFVMSEGEQRFFNSVRLFSAGILRKETGAVITPDEQREVYRRYFPMPGDSQRTIKDKAASRKAALDAMRAGLPGGKIRGYEPPKAEAPSATPSAADPSKMSDDELRRRLGIDR